MARNNRRRRRPLFRNRPGPEQHRELLRDPMAAPTQVQLIAYGTDEIIERTAPSLEEIASLVGQFPVVWLDISGLADVELIKSIGRQFSIHSLVMEDIVRTHQRSKVEDYPDALFIVARMAPVGTQEETEQLSLYLTANCLITFQEFPGDDLDSVRNRIRQQRGRMRALGTDYLAYAIIDAVIDAYFPLVDKSADLIEQLEDRLITTQDRNVLSNIYQVRRKLLELRRAIWPFREMLASIHRNESPLISKDTQVFFRDCYDHTIQLIDLMENYRELAANLMDVYLSSVSNRLNDIMRILTIISVIFIPLTFIVGVYGMNFHTEASPWNMPELAAYYGYPICWAVMIFIALMQLIFFWKKGWLAGVNK